MGKSGKKFYAVHNGRNAGVFNNWEDCKSQVSGYKNAVFKSFATKEEAAAFSRNGYQNSSRSNSFNNTPYAPRTTHSSRKYDKNSSSALPAKNFTTKYTETIYTDGSAFNNGYHNARAGWGVYWGCGDSRNASGPVTVGEKTNNRGELQAINHALDTISKNSESGDRYLIRADSQYSLQALTTWGDNWERNSYQLSTGDPVKNQDLIKSSRSRIKDLARRGVKVDIEYVPAHSGHEGNEEADKLAKQGAS